MKNIEQKKFELLNIFIEDIPAKTKHEKVRELLGNDFYILDTSLKLIMSSDYDDNNPFIKKIDDFYFIDPKLFVQIVSDDDLRKLENDEILIKQYEYFNKRFMVQRISNGKYTMGYACIYLSDESLIEDNKELLMIGTKALSHELKVNNHSNSIEQVVFSRILDGSLSNKEEINLAIKKANIVIDGERRLTIIRTNQIQKVCFAIIQCDSDMKFFIYRDDVICFSDKTRDGTKQFLDKLKEALQDVTLTIGVSSANDDIFELPTIYYQAIEAIEIGEKYSPNEEIHYFGDFRIISIFRSLDRQQLEKSIDRRVKRIIRYDLENKTTYYNDLKAYFESARNINKTAEKLFVHKNSIYYRLQKIQELFDIDFEDEYNVFLVELSIKIMELLNNFKE